MSVETALPSRLCLTLEVQVGRVLVAGDPGGGVRRCIPLLGGTFSGDLEGEVVPGGADWQSVLPDGRIELSAHYALKTRQGAVLEVSSIGLRHASEEVLARLGRGEHVPRDEYYFRTHMRFSTGAPELSHWNVRLFVSAGERGRDGVLLRVFEVL